MQAVIIREQSSANNRHWKEHVQTFVVQQHWTIANLENVGTLAQGHEDHDNSLTFPHSFGRSRPTVTRVDPLPCIYTAMHRTFASYRRKRSKLVRPNDSPHMKQTANSCQGISSPILAAIHSSSNPSPNPKQTTPSGTTSTSAKQKQIPPVRTLRTDPLSAFSLHTPDPTNLVSKYKSAQPCPSTPANRPS
jgi:hypothetical protein